MTPRGASVPSRRARARSSTLRALTGSWCRAVLVATLATTTLGACGPSPGALDGRPASAAPRAQAVQAAQLAQMHEACVAAMIRSTCQVMVGSAAEDAATTVVVAGVGRVDAQAYRELRDAGDAMCSVARGACEKDWGGSSCRSARALWATEQVASR
jgi:hypothetical protein